MDFRIAYLESARAEFARYRNPGRKALDALSLVQAVNRQISHYAYHIGQIVLLAKQFRGAEWVTLSVAKGKSAEYSQGDYTKPQ